MEAKKARKGGNASRKSASKQTEPETKFIIASERGERSE